MAAQDVSATGADLQGDVKRRNVGAPNGNYIPKALDEKVDEKTKQKVWRDRHHRSPPSRY